MPTRDRPDQTFAARIVESLDPEARLHLADKPGAPNRTWDYDVERNGALIGALEVTVLMDERRAAFDGALYARQVIEAPGLSYAWHVALSKDSLDLPKGVNEIRAKVLPALAQLEAREMERFDRDPMRSFRIEMGLGEGEREPLLMDDLPVSFALRYESGEGPTVLLLGPPSGATVWAGSTHEAIAEALAGVRLEGERDKLDRSQREERHLFIWVEPTRFAAYSGIASDENPAASAPELPEEVTHIWVAAARAQDFVVWRSTGGLWTRDTAEIDPHT
jgi:hypothetical protein